MLLHHCSTFTFVKNSIGVSLWLLFIAISPSLVVHADVQEDCGASGTIADDSPSDGLLKWSPPVLEDPIIQDVAEDKDKDFYLKSDVDYVLQMPDESINETIRIFGGRNIVMIGGEINIPDQGKDASITSRTGLKIFDFKQTEHRIIHIEGLLIQGEDLSEGIQISAPTATIQIQNVRIEDIHARDQIEFTDNHPDLIQTWGNVKELRIDYFTGSTDYQGLFFKADYNGPHGAVKLSNVNIVGRSTARYLVWFQPEEGAGDVLLENVWVKIPKERTRGLGDAVWPPVQGEFPEQVLLNIEADYICAGWPDEMQPLIAGFIQEDISENADFVQADAVGITYVSPGYIVNDS